MKNLKELSIKDLEKIFENEAQDHALQLLAYIKNHYNLTSNDPRQILTYFNKHIADFKKTDPANAARQERMYGPIIRAAVQGAARPEYKSWWAQLAATSHGLTKLAHAQPNSVVNSSKIYIGLGSTLFEVKIVALKNNRVGVKILERVKPTNQIKKFVSESSNSESDFKIFLKSDQKFVSLTESKIWTTL